MEMEKKNDSILKLKLYCTTLRTLTSNRTEPTRRRREKKNTVHMQSPISLEGYAHLSFFMSSYFTGNIFFPFFSHLIFTPFSSSVSFHMSHQNVNSCPIFFPLLFLFAQNFFVMKRKRMFSKSQGRLLRKVVTSFYNPFKLVKKIGMKTRPHLYIE